MIVIDEDKFPLLMADQDMQDLVEENKIECMEQGGDMVITLKKGTLPAIQFEIIDKLITLGIDYQLRL